MENERNEIFEQEEQNVPQEAQKDQNQADIFIDKYKELKKNSVLKSEYDKIKEERDSLVKEMMEGKFYEENPKAEEKESVKDLIKDLNSSNISNLEYAEKSLKLRDIIYDQTGKDIFVADNKVYTPTDADYEHANNVAAVYRECIDYAKGDNIVFTNELMRRTNEGSLNIRKPR